MKRRRRALRRTRAAVTGDGDDEEEVEEKEDEDLTDPDMITKPYIPEIVFEDFTLGRDKMKEILNECLKDTKTPKVVVDLIVEYSCLYSIGDVNDEGLLKTTRIILRNCFFVQFVIFASVLELVVKNCGGADIQILNVERLIRVYNSMKINIYTKGECTSYRFEKCNECMVEGLDTRRRVIFMSLFSEKLGFKMYNAYFPNDSSRCVAQYGYDKENENDDDNDDEEECYMVIFRKDIDICSFGMSSKLSVKRGATMIPFL